MRKETPAFPHRGQDSHLVTLSNEQIQTIAATAYNDFKILDKNSAIATVQGTSEIPDICARSGIRA